ncbi:MAG: phenylacetate-CoA oxygenase subunit PaaC [Aureispira sp.]|nr:phenylacetate-CoA oxygenase subunit PaaC [Aureispira sp.]
MTKKEALYNYIIQTADNNLILGQRLSELCGHGPELEVDIGLTNIALDLIGHARSLYQYAAEIQNLGKDEDQLAFLRARHEYFNVLLVEQPNEDFAYTIARQFFFSVFNYLFYSELQNSNDSQLAAIAEKSLKEVAYHIRYSSEWMIRLGDGTDVSHKKMQVAVDDLWKYTAELYTMSEVDQLMLEEGIGIDLNKIKALYLAKVEEVMEEATLTIPTNGWTQKGGKEGQHTEHLGHILTEMQWMQRTYPNMKW